MIDFIQLRRVIEVDLLKEKTVKAFDESLVKSGYIVTFQENSSGAWEPDHYKAKVNAIVYSVNDRFISVTLKNDGVHKISVEDVEAGRVKIIAVAESL
jgi:hypothetical protein